EDMNKNIDAIIVEGKRDESVFISLGFSKKIIKCSSKDLESIEQEIKKLKNKDEKIKVSIFTDFDEKGRELNKKIKAYLQKNGIVIENFYRSKMKEIAFNLKEIEELNREISNFKIIL
ncbi:MAG: toprim domain-containing protein, partial [Candidatus Aenigmatarchaeota archaeon]